MTISGDVTQVPGDFATSGEMFFGRHDRNHHVQPRPNVR